MYEQRFDTDTIIMRTSRPSSESSSKELKFGCKLNQTWTRPDLNLSLTIIGYLEQHSLKCILYSCTKVNAAVQSLCPIIIVRLLAILKGVRT